LLIARPSLESFIRISCRASLVAAIGEGCHFVISGPCNYIPARVFLAMHKRPRLVDRDEETCRKRCLALMNIMVGSMPMAAKYALLRDEFEIFNAIDEACFVLGEQAEQESAAQRTQPMHKTELDGTSLHASSPSSRSAEHHHQAKQSIQCSVSSPSKMTEAVCHHGLDAKVVALIEKNRREALARRDLKRAADAQMIAKKQRDQEIFAGQQWLP